LKHVFYLSNIFIFDREHIAVCILKMNHLQSCPCIHWFNIHGLLRPPKNWKN
jgi:hypothetical protein